jgi:hypothetical protein
MPSSIASSYVLEGSAADLKSHVGHKVEVTGTPEAPKAGEPPAASASRAADSTPRLKVSSVRMIAADCSPK